MLPSLSMDIHWWRPTPRTLSYGAIQIDLEVNQPGGAGFISVDGGNYPGAVGTGNFNQNTVSWPVSQAVRTALDAYPESAHATWSCLLAAAVAGKYILIIFGVTNIPKSSRSLLVREIVWMIFELRRDTCHHSADWQQPHVLSRVRATRTTWVANPAGKPTTARSWHFARGFPNDPTGGRPRNGFARNALTVLQRSHDSGKQRIRTSCRAQGSLRSFGLLEIFMTRQSDAQWVTSIFRRPVNIGLRCRLPMNRSMAALVVGCPIRYLSVFGVGWHWFCRWRHDQL